MESADDPRPRRPPEPVDKKVYVTIDLTAMRTDRHAAVAQEVDRKRSAAGTGAEPQEPCDG